MAVAELREDPVIAAELPERHSVFGIDADEIRQAILKGCGVRENLEKFSLNTIDGKFVMLTHETESRGYVLGTRAELGPSYLSHIIAEGHKFSDDSCDVTHLFDYSRWGIAGFGFRIVSGGSR